MPTRREAVLTLAACGAAWLGGCAGPLGGIPRGEWGKPAELGAFSFEFLDLRARSLLANIGNQPIPAAGEFLIVAVAVTNRSTRPVMPALQPMFRLLNPRRAMYSPHPANTVLLNRERGGMVLYNRPIGPGERIEQELVYDVPVDTYDLLVTIPATHALGFNSNRTPIESHLLVQLPVRRG